VTPPSTAPTPPTRAYTWYALGLLALINLLNYIDRNVIYALFEPIKRDLALTDSQLGWLGSAYICLLGGGARSECSATCARGGPSSRAGSRCGARSPS
jgi:hypothetical protein